MNILTSQLWSSCGPAPAAQIYSFGSMSGHTVAATGFTSTASRGPGYHSRRPHPQCRLHRHRLRPGRHRADRRPHLPNLHRPLYHLCHLRHRQQLPRPHRHSYSPLSDARATVALRERLLPRRAMCTTTVSARQTTLAARATAATWPAATMRVTKRATSPSRSQ